MPRRTSIGGPQQSAQRCIKSVVSSAQAWRGHDRARWGLGGGGRQKVAAPTGLPAPTTGCAPIPHSPSPSCQPVVGRLMRPGVCAKYCLSMGLRGFAGWFRTADLVTGMECWSLACLSAYWDTGAKMVKIIKTSRNFSSSMRYPLKFAILIIYGPNWLCFNDFPGLLPNLGGSTGERARRDTAAIYENVACQMRRWYGTTYRIS